MKHNAYSVSWRKVCRRWLRTEGVFIEWVGHVATSVRIIDSYPTTVGEIRHRWTESPIPVRDS